MKHLIFILLATSFVLWSCGTAKNKKASSKMHRVDLLVNIQATRCGGAPPPRDMPTEYPHAEASYLLKSGILNDHDFSKAITITTDIEGKFSTTLTKGTYSLYFPEKAMEYAAYREKMRSRDKFLKEMGEECFKKMFDSAEMSFTVDSDTTLILLQKNRCFSGFNACLKYDGPLPN